MTRILATLILLAFGAAVQAADVMYVDDHLRVSLRSGQSAGTDAVAVLESGTRLEVIEVSGRYVRVRDPKGNEGWVRDRYLTDQPIARDQLARAEKKIASLVGQRSKLREQISSAESARKETDKTLTQLERDHARLQKKFDELAQSAAEPAKLLNDNKALNEQVATLEEEAKTLRAENAKLNSGANRQWFLTGAGVLGGGMIIGLILPSLRRRRSRWSSDF